MPLINEEQVENQSIEWFKDLNYEFQNGYEISPEGIKPERENLKQVILEKRLSSSLKKINAELPSKVIDHGISQILNLNII